MCLNSTGFIHSHAMKDMTPQLSFGSKDKHQEFESAGLLESIDAQTCQNNTQDDKDKIQFCWKGESAACQICTIVFNFPTVIAFTAAKLSIGQLCSSFQ
jgi:hypothetical protein